MQPATGSKLTMRNQNKLPVTDRKLSLNDLALEAEAARRRLYRGEQIVGNSVVVGFLSGGLALIPNLNPIIEVLALSCFVAGAIVMFIVCIVWSNLREHLGALTKEYRRCIEALLGQSAFDNKAVHELICSLYVFRNRQKRDEIYDTLCEMLSNRSEKERVDEEMMLLLRNKVISMRSRFGTYQTDNRVDFSVKATRILLASKDKKYLKQLLSISTRQPKTKIQHSIHAVLSDSLADVQGGLGSFELAETSVRASRSPENTLLRATDFIHSPDLAEKQLLRADRVEQCDEECRIDTIAQGP